MKYLVTGGAGFIGSNLVDKLVADGHEVHVLDNFCSGKKENCNEKANYYNLDISDSSLNRKFIEIMNNTYGLFHLAALPTVQLSIDDPITYEKNNTIGTLNMLKCAHDAKIKRFIYSGSSSVYGNTDKLPLKESDFVNPISPYAAQKYYGEIYCKMFSQIYGLETVSLRYFNVYGERQNMDGAYALVIAIFIQQKINNKPLTIRGDGEQRRDFTYVGDVVEANILAMKSNNVGLGEVINIGRGKNQSINQIAKTIGQKSINIDPVVEPRKTLSDNSLAKKLLNWEPKMDVSNWIIEHKKSLGL